ncbi:VOC family protein [Microbacterium binotii]|uniref:VOC domain-containing protein n=1 Tax=Microbacterium binotii TaxID=462710 RepID=A0ABN3P8S2_9MICO
MAARVEGPDVATIAQLRRARDRMDRDYAKPLDVEALARSIPMSAGHFSRQFRRLFGSYFGMNLAIDAVFARVEASGADIVQEPIEQDYGLRDAAFRDPAGNLIRIQQNKEQQA